MIQTIKTVCLKCLDYKIVLWGELRLKGILGQAPTKETKPNGNYPPKF